MTRVWIQLNWQPERLWGRQSISQIEKMTGQKIRMRTAWKDVRFTAVEGVPGVRLQHIRSVLRDAASLQTLGMRLHWETDVTGQGLGDVVHTVHLQIGLVWTIQRRRVRQRWCSIGKGEDHYFAVFMWMFDLMLDTFYVSCWKDNTAININLYRPWKCEEQGEKETNGEAERKEVKREEEESRSRGWSERIRKKVGRKQIQSRVIIIPIDSREGGESICD